LALVRENGIAPQGHLAAAAQGPGKGPLGPHAMGGGSIVEGRHPVQHIGPVGPDFDAQGALARSGQGLFRGQNGPDTVFHPQTDEARRRQDNGVVLAFVQLAHPGIQIAPQALDLQMGILGPQNGLTAQAGGAHHGPVRQLVQAGVLGGNKGVPGIFPGGNGGQGKAFRHIHGHVFEGMDGQIGRPFRHGHFQFLDEQALATDGGQGTVQDLVAPGGHAQDDHFSAGIEGLEAALDMFSLPHGQAGLPGGDNDAGGRIGGVLAQLDPRWGKV